MSDRLNNAYAHDGRTQFMNWPRRARTKAKKALGELAAGRDPFPSALGETFGQQVPRFLDRQRPKLRPKNFIDVHRYLTQHAAPLHRMPLAKIGRREIAALLANVERDSGPSARNRLRASLSTFLAFAISEGLVDRSPVTGTAMVHEAARDPPSRIAIWLRSGTRLGLATMGTLSGS